MNKYINLRRLQKVVISKMNTAELTVNLSSILSILTSIALMGLGWYYAHQKSKSDELKKLEKKNEEKKNKELTEKLNNAIDRINEVSENAETTKDTLDSLARDLAEVENLSKLNGQYTHELAQLVTTLSEGLRDNHLDGNITRAVERYRAFESKAMESFVTGEYLHSSH